MKRFLEDLILGLSMVGWGWISMSCIITEPNVLNTGPCEHKK